MGETAHVLRVIGFASDGLTSSASAYREHLVRYAPSQCTFSSTMNSVTSMRAFNPASRSQLKVYVEKVSAPEQC